MGTSLRLAAQTACSCHQQPFEKKPMKIKAIGIALLLSHSLSYGKLIFGNYDCGQWFVIREPAKAWLLGYLSGINAMMANDKINYDPLKKLNSAEQAFLWMDNYCKANPLSSVVDGASDLYLELQKK
jgi:hypothetical protein